jgi:hypothetical protein
MCCIGSGTYDRAVQSDERGFNEIDGVPDTHGGTSHLNASEVDDLVAYLESL